MAKASAVMEGQASRSMTSAELQTELDDANAKVEELQARVANLALDAVQGNLAAEQDLVSCEKELVLAQRRATRLSNAHAASVHRDAAVAAKRQADEHAAIVRRAREILAGRDDIAHLIERAIGELSDLRTAFHHRNLQLQTLLPAGVSMPRGSIANAGELHSAISVELFRSSHDVVNQLSALPGGHPATELGAQVANISEKMNPAAYKTLSEFVASNSAYALRTISTQLGVPVQSSADVDGDVSEIPVSLKKEQSNASHTPISSKAA